MKLRMPNKCFVCKEKIPKGDGGLIMMELRRYKPWEVGQFQQMLTKLCKGKIRQMISAICYRCFMKEVIGKRLK